MSQVTASKLKADVDQILPQVQEDGEQVEVLVDGEVIARIIPVGPRDVLATNKISDLGAFKPRPLSPEERERLEVAWEMRDQLTKRLARSWPEGVSVVDVVRDVRRDL